MIYLFRCKESESHSRCPANKGKSFFNLLSLLLIIVSISVSQIWLLESSTRLQYNDANLFELYLHSIRYKYIILCILYGVFQFVRGFHIDYDCVMHTHNSFCFIHIIILYSLAYSGYRKLLNVNPVLRHMLNRII